MSRFFVTTAIDYVNSRPHLGTAYEKICADVIARSALIVSEWRAGESRWFAARVLHRLRRTPPGLRIALKRVDLADSEAPHRALAVPF